MCPAPDVPSAESGSQNGPESPQSAPLSPSLEGALVMVARAVMEQVAAINRLVDSNARLIAALAEMSAGAEDEEEIEPTTFLSGKRR